MSETADPAHAAVVTSHQPQGSATTGGGEAVIITGSGFLGATSVSIGFPSPAFQVKSDTEIHALAPAWDPSQFSERPRARVVVWKDSLGSDDSQLPEWTWGGLTLAQLQATVPRSIPAAPVGDMNHRAVV